MNSALTLGFIAVTDNISVALVKDGVFMGEINLNLSKIDNIVLLIENLLKKLDLSVNDISEVNVVSGPGKYAGIRIAVTIAKTMATLQKIPIKAINSIELYAYQARMFEGLILVCMESRKGEYNYGMYGSNNFELNEIIPAETIKKDVLFSKLLKIDGRFIIVGDTRIEEVPDELKDKVMNVDLSAVELIKCASTKQSQQIGDVAPFYAYPVNIGVKKKKK